MEHDHSGHEHPNPNLHDDPSSTPLIMGGVVGTLLVIVTIIATSALYFGNEKKFRSEIVYDVQAAEKTTAARLKDAQLQNLTGKPVWADRARGRIERLPISQAIQLVAAEGGNRKPDPATSQPSAGPNSPAALAAAAKPAAGTAGGPGAGTASGPARQPSPASQPGADKKP